MYILFIIVVIYLAMGLGLFAGIYFGKGPINSWQYRLTKKKEFRFIEKMWTKILFFLCVILMWPHIAWQLVVNED